MANYVSFEQNCGANLHRLVKMVSVIALTAGFALIPNTANADETDDANSVKSVQAVNSSWYDTQLGSYERELPAGQDVIAAPVAAPVPAVPATPGAFVGRNMPYRSAGAWVSGTHVKRVIEPKNSSYNVTKFDASRTDIEAGIDFTIANTAIGIVGLGVNGIYQLGEATQKMTSDTVKLETSGYGGGMSLHYTMHRGTYIVIKGQYTSLLSDISSVAENINAKEVKGEAFNGTAEIGYQFPIYETADRLGVLSMTPQLQLEFNKTRYFEFTGSSSNTISTDDGTTGSWRAGFTLDYEHIVDVGSVDFSTVNMIAYGLANIYYNFNNVTSLKLNDTVVTFEEEKWVPEVGLGLDIALNGGAQYLHTEIAGSWLDEAHGYRGQVGLGLRF